MDGIRLDHLNLSARDLDESVAWYGRVFGFAVAEEGVWDGVRWAILRSGDALLCAYHHPEFRFVDNDGLRSRYLHGIRHPGFRIANEARWLETVRREALEVEEIVYPHSRSWYVNDPTGYEIEVVHWNDDRVVFERATKEGIR
ncbi:MAG: VOC family protein [Planctomycetes bacterium]|nr:VOC family protein [Planctomycetota bacterium]